MPLLDKDLDKKASSVLLRKEFRGSSHPSDSSRSRGVRECASSSTLHSHYDAHSAPLAISQQTSASSARDLALRKGNTPVAKMFKPKSGANDSTALKPQKSDSLLRRRKPKPAPIDISTLFPRPGSVKQPLAIRGNQQAQLQNRSTNLSAASSTTSVSTIKLEHSAPMAPRSRDGKHASKPTQSAQGIQADPMCPKVNVRRPKAGVKEWFDDIDDQSDDEWNSEPDLQSNFVDYIETAFKNGEIRPRTAPEQEPVGEWNPETFLDSPPSKGPNRLVTLDEKVAGISRGKSVPHFDFKIPQASFSGNLSRPQKDSTSEPLGKTNRLEAANLNEESVLWLSSSDDEEEPHTITLPTSRNRTTVIRDSLAIDPIDVAEIEIGTAKAVSKQELQLSQTPQIKRLRSVRKNSPSSTDYNVPTRRSSKMFSYLNDTSSDSRAPSTITSFPSDFSDVDSEELASESIRSSLYTDPENTRLMTVTRQEELLLAAMRAKRANLGGKVSRSSIRSLSDGSSRRSLRLYHPTPRNLQTGTPLAEQLDRGLRRTSNTSIRFRDLNGIREFYRRSGVYSRASGTTFQSNRLSTATFQSSVNDFADECSSSPDDSQESPETPHATLEPESMSQRSNSVVTDATASPVNQYQHSRRRTDSGNIIVLDDLDAAPKRDTLSQEFIEWPYSGWNSQAGLAVAH